jgi:phytoene dehydrogenase-like protein
VIDAIVVGSGPNGLAAAVTLARAGLAVELHERMDAVGGGLRTAELTLPGYWHDVCAAVHPAGLASPFFRAFELTQRVDFIVPAVSYAHPLDDGQAGIAYRDLNLTADALGRDGAAWKRMLAPIIHRLNGVVSFTGSQLLQWPQHPAAALAIGLRALEQGSSCWNLRFEGEVARAMITGVAAHASSRHPSPTAAAAGLLLAAHAHARGWGFPVGGSQAIADALAEDFVAHGGVIRLGHNVRTADDLEPSRAVILDTSTQFLQNFADLPPAYARRLRRYRYGSGSAKVDFALSGAIPWANEQVRLSPTVHLGGTRAKIAAAEGAVHRGILPDSPYVLVVQPSVADSTRAPEGHHVVWAYTHVPRGSQFDATEAITRQIEKYAPGFRDLILAAASMSAAELAAHNPNYVGGDILGGELSLTQVLKRPVISRTPWKTPVNGLYLCSSATAPGPAVHGMNGWYAARLALMQTFGMRRAPKLGR